MTLISEIGDELTKLNASISRSDKNHKDLYYIITNLSENNVINNYLSTLGKLTCIYSAINRNKLELGYLENDCINRKINKLPTSISLNDINNVDKYNFFVFHL